MARYDELVNCVTAYLSSIDCFYWKNDYHKSLLPTIMVLRKGILYGILIRSETALTRSQMNSIRKITKNGGRAYIIENAEEIIHIMNPKLHINKETLQNRLEKIATVMNGGECETYQYCSFCLEKDSFNRNSKTPCSDAYIAMHKYRDCFKKKDTA
jgi:hypothetical protein